MPSRLQPPSCGSLAPPSCVQPSRTPLQTWPPPAAGAQAPVARSYCKPNKRAALGRRRRDRHRGRRLGHKLDGGVGLGRVLGGEGFRGREGGGEQPPRGARAGVSVCCCGAVGAPRQTQGPRVSRDCWRLLGRMGPRGPVKQPPRGALGERGVARPQVCACRRAPAAAAAAASQMLELRPARAARGPGGVGAACARPAG
jgi:hypothetical protein